MKLARIHLKHKSLISCHVIILAGLVKTLLTYTAHYFSFFFSSNYLCLFSVRVVRVFDSSITKAINQKRNEKLTANELFFFFFFFFFGGGGGGGGGGGSLLLLLILHCHILSPSEHVLKVPYDNIQIITRNYF